MILAHVEAEKNIKSVVYIETCKVRIVYGAIIFCKINGVTQGGEKKLNRNDDWGITELEFERLVDAVEAGIIPLSEALSNRENIKNGYLTVSEFIGIWSNDDE